MGDRTVLQSRTAAAERLATDLADFGDDRSVVLGLSPGGMVLADVIARKIGATLLPLVVRKIRPPDHPESVVGAVAPGGILVLNNSEIEALGLDESSIDEAAARERAEKRRRMRNYGATEEIDVENRDVILVDDGLQTGLSAIAALEFVRRRHPARIAFAVGVCPRAAVAHFAEEMDLFRCAATPDPFYSVADAYAEFPEVDEDEVISIMKRHGASEEAARS